MGSLWEGAFDEETRSLELALWLLAAAVLILAVGGASLRLGGFHGSWFAGFKRIMAKESQSFLDSHGIWRWAGLAFLYAGSWIFFPKRKPVAQKIEGRLVGLA